MMNNVQSLQNRWNELRGEVKRHWSQLDDDDLQVQECNIDYLVDRIQQKTGEGRETIERFLTDLTARASPIVSRAAETVGGYVHEASDQFCLNTGRFYDEAQERFDQAQDVVRQNPVRSVAVALGIGLVTGLIVGLAVRSR
jgi:ElaB/YqjD/DUF883 family membrane-anchored ribosome-binding protein